MAQTSSTMLPLGTPAIAFNLPDIHGKPTSLTHYSGTPLLVMFICNHCPFVKHLRDSLAEFGRAYAARGLAVVAINSNDIATHPADAPAKMAIEAQEAGYTFPYLFDATQQVAKDYRAACTPDFFLFDASHTLVYRGQYDGSRPGNAIAITGADLRAAADAVLHHQPVATLQHPSIGCNIKWKSGNAPAYAGG